MKNKKENGIGELEKLRADNARLRAQLQDLTTYIDGRKSQWDALAERLQRERTTIAELETAVGVRDARIAGFARTTARLERRLDGQRIAWPRPAKAASPSDAEVKVILRAAYDKLASMRQEQTRLKAELDDRNAYIDRLCAKLTALQVERSERNKTLRRQQRIIDHIEGEIRARLSQVASENRRPRRQDPSASIHLLDPHRDEPPDAAHTTRGQLGARLTLLAGTDHNVDFEIGTKTLTIGRGSHNDIRIRRQSVSREHARLTPAADGIVIEDLCSRNGVRVNDQRVARQRLRSGDVVTVGRVKFRFSQSVVPFDRHSAS